MRQTRMVCIKIHVDGAGGDNPGYAWVCDQTSEERFVSMPAHTNNETEYLAIISALEHFGASHDKLGLYRHGYLVLHDRGMTKELLT